jgi:glutathione S-transferase
VPYDVKIMSFQAGDTRKPEFVALNPRHTVPTIVDEGHAVWESMAILEYLDEKFTSGAKLYPGDAKARARVRRLIREAEEHVGIEGIDPIADEYFGKGGAEPDREKVEKARTRLKEELEYFAKS